MSAPSIPNLLSLRGGRGGRGRGRGRGGHAGSSSTSASHDATIQGTDTDAAVSRLSAVELGYLDDHFAEHFVSPAGRMTRRLPIINRGTFVRTFALDKLVSTFLHDANEQGRPPQIISLGAGTDTRPFRLFSGNPQGLIYHEIDFPATCRQKFTTVGGTPVLRRALPNPDSLERAGTGSWHSSHPQNGEYWCHGLDLRDLARNPDTIALPGLRADLPTLLISECCLCYLETSDASSIIGYFKDRITAASSNIILYEPIRPDDPFGRQMVSNLAARGIRMPTVVEDYKTPQDQERRLLDAGFPRAGAFAVDEVWDSFVGATERERVDRLEGLDEVEEWKLLAGHYVIAWASTNLAVGLR